MPRDLVSMGNSSGRKPGAEDLDVTFLSHSGAQRWQNPFGSQRRESPDEIHSSQLPKAERKGKKGRERISWGQKEDI